MIESNIIVPSVLPDFEVPELAPNYWQELAAYVWVSTLHGMEADGQKVRQEELIDGHSVEMAVHDLLVSWLVGEGDGESLFEAQFTSVVNEISSSLSPITIELRRLETVLAYINHNVNSIAGKTTLNEGTPNLIDEFFNGIGVDVVAPIVTELQRIAGKTTLNEGTPNLIDDFFSNIVIDSDAIKVAIVAIQSILEGGNLVLDLVAEAIKEQVTASEDNNEVLQEISNRLFDEESELNITETLTVTGDKLSIPATETEPERSITEVVQNLSVMPNELHLHVSNLNSKESQEYVERWSAS